MAMSDVLQLVTDLSDGLNDSTACTNYYSDVVYLMGLDPGGTLVNASTIDPVVLVPQTTLPASSITTLAVLYDVKHLSKTGRKGAQAWDTHWFTTLGQPFAWLDEDQNRHTITEIPIPVTPPTVGLPRDPSISNPGQNGLTVIYTETRTNAHGDEELAMALEIMAREFSRDSDHTDHTSAQTCRTLSGVLFGMIDVSLVNDIPGPAQELQQQEGSAQ